MRHLVCLFILVFKIGVSQNVVPNFNFEGSSSKENFTVIDKVYSWYSPNNGTPDYKSFDDNFAVGFYLYSVESNKREYLAVKLNRPLDDSIRYRIKYRAKVRGDNRFAISYLSVIFTHASLKAENQDLIDTVPQVTTSSIVFLEKTGVWFEVTDTFKVSGGEQFMTFGNFFPDRRSGMIEFTDDEHRHDWNYAYIYIDDVEVTEIPNPVFDSLDVRFPRDTVQALEPLFTLRTEPYDYVSLEEGSESSGAYIFLKPNNVGLINDEREAK